MKRKYISALDVAKVCGVSRTTVSFVLNNTPGKKISEETRQKVLKISQELNYIPNPQARKLALTRHFSIGFFICHPQSIFSDAFIPKLIEGIAQRLNKYRIRLVLQPVKLKQSNYFELARNEDIDGIILINTHDRDEGLKYLIEKKFPLVVIGKITDERVVQIDIDNSKSAREAVEYLINLGHTNIAMITHASTIYCAAHDRFEGYLKAIRSSGIKLDQDLIKTGNFTEDSGYQAMSELLDLTKRPTAVFTGNDVIAYGAIKAIKDRGLKIPDDISIIGFDDDYLSRYLNPPLTTVAVPAEGLGSEAATLLMKMIEINSLIKPQRKILHSHFFIRESCRELK